MDCDRHRWSQIPQVERFRCYVSRHGRSLDQEKVVAKGTVKWFNAQKGYGFIEQADGGKDVFVHVAELAPGVGTLSENQAVEFEVQGAPTPPPRAPFFVGPFRAPRAATTRRRSYAAGGSPPGRPAPPQRSGA
jgi:CspA family cold shock protein